MKSSRADSRRPRGARPSAERLMLRAVLEVERQLFDAEVALELAQREAGSAATADLVGELAMALRSFRGESAPRFEAILGRVAESAGAGSRAPRELASQAARRLVTPAQLAELYPALKPRTIRYWLQGAADRTIGEGGVRRVLAGNGLAPAVIRKGRVILVDLELFEKWLHEGSDEAGHGAGDGRRP